MQPPPFFFPSLVSSLVRPFSHSYFLPRLLNHHADAFAKLSPPDSSTQQHHAQHSMHMANTQESLQCTQVTIHSSAYGELINGNFRSWPDQTTCSPPFGFAVFFKQHLLVWIMCNVLKWKQNRLRRKWRETCLRYLGKAVFREEMGYYQETLAENMLFPTVPETQHVLPHGLFSCHVPKNLPHSVLSTLSSWFQSHSQFYAFRKWLCGCNWTFNPRAIRNVNISL